MAVTGGGEVAGASGEESVRVPRRVIRSTVELRVVHWRGQVALQPAVRPRTHLRGNRELMR